jgi:hypothetical protein
LIFEGIGGQVRLAQIVVRKSVAVDDEDAVRFQVLDVRLEGGGIHRHQHVDGVSGRKYVARGKLNLEAAYSGKGARRGANFGWVIGKRCQVVSVERHRIGELVARNLHAVAGVSAKAENCFFDDFALMCADNWVRNRSHGLEKLQFLIMNFNHPAMPQGPSVAVTEVPKRASNTQA